MALKSDNGFAWISAQPLLEPLLNMHAASYMSVITYLNMLLGDALREVFWQRVGKFLLKSIITLCRFFWQLIPVTFSWGSTSWIVVSSAGDDGQTETAMLPSGG